MWKNLLLLILAGMLVGCAYTAGRKYDTTAMDRIGSWSKPRESQVYHYDWVCHYRKKNSVMA